MVACPNDKIINPATGRCVSKTGAIGKALEKKEKKKSPTKKISTSSKKEKEKEKEKEETCPSDKIINPATGRCVSKTGLVGKSILAGLSIREEMNVSSSKEKVKKENKEKKVKEEKEEKKERKEREESRIHTPKNPINPVYHPFYKEGVDNFVYSVEHAPSGRATCLFCKEKIEKGELRLARHQDNAFGDGSMAKYFHVDHAFKAFLKARCKSTHITWDKLGNTRILSDAEKQMLYSKIQTFKKQIEAKCT
jgi:hypothetical protein